MAMIPPPSVRTKSQVFQKLDLRAPLSHNQVCRETAGRMG